ncbi:retrovirus-related pol polyprotein from [Plakobranchus ocellatus]|uniref:Retrovirus-related pol polyprotein from n=1 Tax=Plakobranchus ocellatus TaxID=259542 RepID=A0AAV3YM95_9GAST|nr:retrovirus-related pol polyprotein from [Plakobranchus ocellatus]
MRHRIVIPASLRPSILSAPHAAHQGVGIMCARAADSVFWPNIITDITRIRDECTQCHRTTKSNPIEPLCDITPLDYPIQRICADYFSFNNTEYLVVVARFSSWPIVYRSTSGADGLVKRLREIFVTFGVPEELTTDGGPQQSMEGELPSSGLGVPENRPRPQPFPPV